MTALRALCVWALALIGPRIVWWGALASLPLRPANYAGLGLHALVAFVLGFVARRRGHAAALTIVPFAVVPYPGMIVLLATLAAAALGRLLRERRGHSETPPSGFLVSLLELDLVRARQSASKPGLTRRRKITYALIVSSSLAAVTEWVVGLIAPPTRMGSLQAEKSRIYGWAANPHSQITRRDPDTGEVGLDVTNSQGWKDAERTFEKPPGRVRILFVGDSNTWGYVPLADLYTTRTEVHLRAKGFVETEVMSAGMTGWGTDQALEFVTREGVLYAPDLIVYQFCWNDVINNLMPTEVLPDRPGDAAWRSAFNTPKTFKYELAGDELRRIDLAPPRLAQLTLDALMNSAIVFNLFQLRRRSVAPPFTYEQLSDRFFCAGRETPEIERAWLLTEALVRRMNEVARAHSARLLVFCESCDEGARSWELRRGKLRTDAQGDHVSVNGERRPVDYRRPLKNLASICKRAGVPLIAPVRTYERFERDQHASAPGNEHMAEDIADFIAAWEPFQARIHAVRHRR